jgi:signal peptidase I
MPQKLKPIIIAAAVTLIVSGGFYLWQDYGWKMGIDASCIKAENHNISGRSLEPLLTDGQEVKGLVGYYECNPAERGQIAILEFKNKEESFVKKIAGLPGDSVEFTEDDRIKLNGGILENSAGEPYLFSGASQNLITIPLNDAKIPEGKYLMLSEETLSSSFDSRQFGFVEKEHLKGRVIY